MSALALSGAASGADGGEQAAAQRVAQLQALIEASRQLGSASTPATATTLATGTPLTSATSYVPGSSGDFASALQAATSADQASAAGGAATAESSQYEPLIEQAAARNGLDPAVLHGLIEQESGFDASSTSSAGASGLTQLMPGTAASLGVANPLDPAESIEGGARYLGELMRQFAGNTADALAAYNAGPGAVQQYGGIPPYAETEAYVSKVLANAETYRQSSPAASTVGVPPASTVAVPS